MPRAHTTFKVVVTGPFNAGKTTLISTISEIPVLTTETAVSGAASARKRQTTVSMDFGRLTIPGDPVIELAMFGTPGQARFDFMWNVLAKGMLGYVLLVDACDPSTWEEAGAILDHFRGLGDMPYVVGANKASATQDGVGRLRAALDLSLETVVVPCDVVEAASAKEVLLLLLQEVLVVIERREHSGQPVG